MVDKESENYRPRRAFIESGSDPAAGKKSGSDGPAPPAQTPPAQTPADPDAGDAAPRFPTLGPLLDDDQPKPLYRDEVAPPSPRPPTGAASGPDETSIRPITFAPRRPPSFDDEPTTILPRSRSTARPTSSRETFDDFDEEEHKPAHPRTRLALLIGAVAAVIVIGLAVGYAVIGIGKSPQANPGPTATTGGSAPGSTQGPSPGTSSTELLTDALLLNPDQAATLVP